MDKVRIGIIGCGGIANGKHMPALKKLPQVEMVAFCDIIEEKAIKAAKEYGVPGAKVFTDYKQLLEEKDIDVVHVLTPNKQHSFITVDALEAGKHVMCEKPMAINSAEAKKMLDAAHRTGRQAARQALLDAYDGAMATRQITVYAAPSDSAASLRTLRQGKVARLNDVTEDGSWYQITFSGTTGYVRSDACQAVQYSDYAGTSAVKSAREDLVDYAKSFLGTRYVWGGASPSGFDCSGFTMYVYAHFGYRMSHGASDQLYAFTRVSSAQRLPGDLVFFSYGGGDISHVGIYLGGGAFIHATSNGGVKISYFDGYYSSTYVGAVRILAD